MKLNMITSGFLCMWAVSQIVIPEPVEAEAVQGYPGGQIPIGPRFLEELFAPKEKPTERTGAGPVVEKNAPNPAVCKGGYRWGRDSPDDIIRKIYC